MISSDVVRYLDYGVLAVLGMLTVCLHHLRHHHLRHRRHHMPLWLLLRHLPPTLPRTPQRHLLRHMARPRHAVRTGCTAPGTDATRATPATSHPPSHPQAAQLLRMTHIWAQTTVAVQETTNGLGLLCRLYLCIAWGLLQPWFLCLALLLCRNAIKCAAPRIPLG